MRLRELRTENAELKIQYRRWLNLSALISVCSLGLTLLMIVFSGDVVVQVEEGKQMFSESSSRLDLRTDRSSSPYASAEDALVQPLASASSTSRSSSTVERSNSSWFGSSSSSPDTSESQGQGAALEAPAMDGFGDAQVSAPPIPDPIASNSFGEGPSAQPQKEPTLVLPSSGFALPGMDEQALKRVEQYRVRKNDNLWGIVKRFYGAATPQRIAKVMRDNGLSGSSITPGMTLLLIIDD